MLLFVLVGEGLEGCGIERGAASRKVGAEGGVREVDGGVHAFGSGVERRAILGRIAAFHGEAIGCSKGDDYFIFFRCFHVVLVCFG